MDVLQRALSAESIVDKNNRRPTSLTYASFSVIIYISRSGRNALPDSRMTMDFAFPLGLAVVKLLTSGLVSSHIQVKTEYESVRRILALFTEQTRVGLLLNTFLFFCFPP